MTFGAASATMLMVNAMMARENPDTVLFSVVRPSPLRHTSLKNREELGWHRIVRRHQKTLQRTRARFRRPLPLQGWRFYMRTDQFAERASSTLHPSALPVVFECTLVKRRRQAVLDHF